MITHELAQMFVTDLPREGGRECSLAPAEPPR